MRLPGFTAELSISTSARVYYTGISGTLTADGKITPASAPARCDGYCSGKYSPQSLDWYICWWACMSYGGFPKKPLPPIIVRGPGDGKFSGL
jgi:hypothetical protein